MTGKRLCGNVLKLLAGIVSVLLAVLAAAMLFAGLMLPILQIHGNSMAETLWDGDIVIATERSEYQPGDVIAFHYEKDILLVKRIIASEGDIVEIDEDGDVYINGALLEEGYVFEKDLGVCSISFPYEVSEGEWFVLGDHRSTSLDSRSIVESVSDEEIIGKLTLRVWPLKSVGLVS